MVYKVLDQMRRGGSYCGPKFPIINTYGKANLELGERGEGGEEGRGGKALEGFLLGEGEGTRRFSISKPLGGGTIYCSPWLYSKPYPNHNYN